MKMRAELSNAYEGRNRDRLEQLGTRIDTLYDAIATGDEAHRAWLKAAIDNHLAGKPVQPQEKS